MTAYSLMSVATQLHPDLASSPYLQFRRLTVWQYQRMIEKGVLGADDRVELLEGWIVKKMVHNPPHEAAIDYAQEILRRMLPRSWRVREQKAISTIDSQPEPDISIVRGAASRYAKRHPSGRDVAGVIEVADATLQDDRLRKGRLYARARIPFYWIINLVEGKVEVYSQPRGGKTPGYRERRDHKRGESVPLTVAGKLIGHIPVSKLLP